MYNTTLTVILILIYFLVSVIAYMFMDTDYLMKCLMRFKKSKFIIFDNTKLKNGETTIFEYKYIKFDSSIYLYTTYKDNLNNKYSHFNYIYIYNDYNYELKYLNSFDEYINHNDLINNHKDNKYITRISDMFMNAVIKIIEKYNDENNLTNFKNNNINKN